LRVACGALALVHDHAAACGFIRRMANPEAARTATMRAVVIDSFGGPRAAA
jgi:hypothetical protein